MRPIEFWFDFSSPYSYLASEQIEAIAERHRRPLQYKPTLLGALFKNSGGAPLTELRPVKSNYFVRDFARCARFVGVPFKMPSVFPVATVGAARALLWLQANDAGNANRFLHAALRAFFAEDRDISEAAVLTALLAELGLDAERVAAGTQEPAIKDQLRALVEESAARGVFGAPTIFIDGEMYWGHDRLPQVERHLASGPF